jgi:vacuolar protein sorting-associated protein 35
MATTPAKPIVPPSEEEQTKLLEDAKNTVKVEAFYMKRNLDNGKLMDALKNASNLISELRTSLLSPKNYYSLYMVAFDELKHLEGVLYEDREKHGKKISELYELVQYAGNILPRLYLLITVGSVYIKSKEAPAKDVLRDLVEMCRGVQHPTRGLFLRNYLSEMTKDKLPDMGCNPADGEVKDSVEFVLSNFTEMNKLWVRLHMGPAREREKREGERMELRLLVGKNLARLSQLEGVDVGMYTQSVLPKVLDQIVGCRDRLAQQYLMEIVIQVFPDEFHLATLEQFLTACSRLVPRVDVKSIVCSLIDRLARFVSSTPSSSPTRNVEMFKIFSRAIEEIARVRSQQESKERDESPAQRAAAAAAAAAASPDEAPMGKAVALPIQDYLAMQVSLLNMSLKCYPDKSEFVDDIMSNVVSHVSMGGASVSDAVRASPQAVQQIAALLQLPLDAYPDPLCVLGLAHYSEVAQLLAYDKRKSSHLSLVRAALARGSRIGTADTVTRLLSVIATLVRDEGDAPDMEEVDKEDFEAEQGSCAALLHLFDNAETEELFSMLFTARKFFGTGGKDRIRHTLPALVFAVLRLAMRNKAKFSEQGAEGDEAKRFGVKLFGFENETIKALHSKGYAELALRLHLQAAQVASACGFEAPAYDFVSQAMTIYEDDIAGSAAQFTAITLVIGTLHGLYFSDTESYETLITKTAKHSTRLMRKADQSRAVCMSSHLFWRAGPTQASNYKDGKRTLECLQKSLKIADSSMDASTNIILFVEILNQYLYYFESRNEAVTVKYLSGLIALINTNLANMDPSNGENASITVFFQNTLEYINAKKRAMAEKSGADLPPYNEIDS